MGKAENNFENKWLEEREDGFFYTMKRLSLKDTQEINAGATYSAKCNYCGKIIEKKFSQQNKVLGNIEKFAWNQGLQTFFFKEKVL